MGDQGRSSYTVAIADMADIKGDYVFDKPSLSG